MSDLTYKNGGFGSVAFGRAEFGQSKSGIEPRFITSDPLDGTANVSIFQQVILFAVYCFSSRVQDDENLLIEISEDGGGSFSDAYANNSFVSPYNGSESKIYDHSAYPSAFIMFINKTIPWENNQQIVVRVTAKDEYGQESTKETPVVWGASGGGGSLPGGRGGP